MPKYPKNYTNVSYYAPNRKRPVAGSSTATNDFLVLVHKNNPDATIKQLRDIITDKRRYILSPEAVTVLDAYIKVGCGEYIPEWR